MEDPSEADRRSGLAAPAELGDALRTAVERTLAATADSATETRQRAQTLLDEVVRRGQVARDEVSRRGEEATNLLGGALSDLRSSTDGEAAGLEERLAGVERRLTALEAAIPPLANAQVETETRSGKPLGQGEIG